MKSQAWFLAGSVAAALTLAGCNTNPVLGGADSTVTGSGGAAGAQNASQELQRCSRPIGTAALYEGNYSGLRQAGLESPLPLIRVMMAQSGCFRVVERGQASSALREERRLAESGELQSGSNMGGGQMAAADFVLTPNVAFKDPDSGGGFGGLGALLPGLAGAVAGGIKTENLEAQTTLLLSNVRSGVQEAAATGTAKKTDVSFGGFGWAGGVAGGGGAYQDTEIGKIVTAAFVDAHNNLVTQMGAMQPSEQREQLGVYRTATSLNLRSGANGDAPVLATLTEGTAVVPTGERQGDWWQVQVQDTGRNGWVHSDYITRE
ncbi:SH3 domain-containing protein [Arhodomonas sp. SL1]|uniref:SH3 domain-containing protein n=1 Tax=Arhodomonas sp. SL1 TaxID=3425691 RepID=UPI003F8828B5